MGIEDKRAAKRISYVCEVECEGAGLNRLATRISDLSLTGAFIDSMTCYAPGASLRLRFRIKDILIEATAEVRYTMPQMGMGVQFLGLKPDQLAVLENLIEGKPLIRTPVSLEQREGGENEPPGWNTPDMLLGNFAIVSMFDIIHIIENNRLTGGLAMMSPSAHGEIQFNEGLIVGAYSGAMTGVDALKRFLDVTEGSFEFKRSHRQYSPTIHSSSNMSLMLQLLRVKDEESAARC